MNDWPHKRFVKARQLPDQIDAPPAGIAGVSGEATLDPNVVPTGPFAFDASASPDTVAQTAPPLAGSFIPEVTVIPDTAPTVSETSGPVSSATHTIPMGTVVTACVGAFIGASVIIIAGVWFYRRSTRRMIAKHRNADNNRRKETWNQLDDDEDKWDSGMSEAKTGPATVSRTPTEKLGVFKKSLSMRTARTEKSDVPSFDSQAFAAYHPKLALEMAGVVNHSTTDREEEASSRAESQVLSWDGGSSFLRSNRAASGAISPSLHKAIPTPVAVTNVDSHHWQSAEVVNLDGMSAVVEEYQSKQPSLDDPFFDPKEHEYMSRAQEHSKGKQKVDNPFDDDAQVNNTLIPASHADSAIQSLIAALGVDTPEPVGPSPFSPTYSTTDLHDDGAANAHIQPPPRT